MPEYPPKKVRSTPHDRAGLPAHAQGAFSLVEVVLALGIFVFAAVPIVGLLPLALRSAKESTETTQQAKIIQRVANDLVQTPFATLTAQINGGTTFSRQFNYDGLETKVAADVYYIATVTLNGFTVPGATASAANLYRVAINVASGRGNGVVNKTMAITVADNGY